MRSGCGVAFGPVSNELYRGRQALQAILDEVSASDSRAKSLKPQDLVDLRYVDEMNKSGFFDKIWASKR